MTTILGILITFGFAIFVHEFGHFILAKIGKFKVEIFSIGFGKRLFGIKMGDTDYRLSIIPFGGYVKMAGEEPRPDMPIETHQFLSKPWWKRMGVYLSGPLFNILFSIPIFIGVYMLGVPALVKPNVVGKVEEGSLGEMAKIMVGDTILEVNGKPVQDWYDIVKKAFSHPSNLIRLKIARDGAKKVIDISANEKITQKTLGLHPLIPAVIGSLRDGYPAKEKGLKRGDTIVSINGEPVEQWNEMTKIIHSNIDDPLLLKIRRGEEEFLVSVMPFIERIIGIDGRVKEIGLIGIGPKTTIRRFPIPIAISKGMEWVSLSVRMVFGSIIRLITGRASLRQITGPIGIAQLVGEKVHQGIGSLLLFIGFLCVNLGVLNLLPIPMLDGGHILFCIIEGIRGRMVSLRVQEIAIKVGLAFVIAIFIIVTFNDITRTMTFKRIMKRVTNFIEGLPWIEERQGLSR